MTDSIAAPNPDTAMPVSSANTHPVRTLILLWLAWAVLIIGFQAVVNWRYQPQRPDYAVEWTPEETKADSQEGKPYLLEPFLNNQVSWDSEYYLSIAVGGYDDPVMRRIPVRDGRQRAQISQNYAFFPLYPQAMQYLSVPLSVLGMNPIATAALAGVLIALAGTLVGMLGLYDLTRDSLGSAGALRTVFYLLIFPSAFFLAQVYTEGLFIGLAFGSLALIRRRRLLEAGALAALATWTRSVGVALVIPLALAWLPMIDWRGLFSGRDRGEASSRATQPLRLVTLLIGVLLPVAAFLIFQQAMGHPFDLIQTTFFGRALFNWDGIQWGLDVMSSGFREGNTQMMVYYTLEIASVVLAAVACLATLRRYPGVALFSLTVLVISATSGAPQSLIRYVLAIPALFIFLGSLGRHTTFDRSWTILSLLLLAMETSLFTWDMWVA